MYTLWNTSYLLHIKYNTKAEFNFASWYYYIHFSSPPSQLFNFGCLLLSGFSLRRSAVTWSRDVQAFARGKHDNQGLPWRSWSCRQRRSIPVPNGNYTVFGTFSFLSRIDGCCCTTTLNRFYQHLYVVISGDRVSYWCFKQYIWLSPISRCLFSRSPPCGWHGSIMIGAGMGLSHTTPARFLGGSVTRATIISLRKSTAVCAVHDKVTQSGSDQAYQMLLFLHTYVYARTNVYRACCFLSCFCCCCCCCCDSEHIPIFKSFSIRQL